MSRRATHLIRVLAASAIAGLLAIPGCKGGEPVTAGPTDTHALLQGSVAVDTALLAECAETDQRGVPRPQRPGCDVGAFESQP